MNREAPPLDLKIGFCITLFAIALVLVTAVYTAPLMLAHWWLSPRAAVFVASIGVTLCIGFRLLASFAWRLARG